MTAQLRTRLQTATTRLTVAQTNILPVALTTIILIVFAAGVVNLTTALNAQVETGQQALDVQLGEQSRSFGQLQREALRLLVFVNDPPEELDVEAAQLQIDLLASRFFQMNAVSNLPAFLEDQSDVARELVERGDGVIAHALEWLETPDDAALRQTVIDELGELERDVNQHIIDFSRVRVQSVIVFRDATTHTQNAFALAGFALVLLMLALLYNIYLYLRQSQATEAARQALRLKDQFLAVMSHELRTPLNAIIGFLGIIKMQGPESPKTPHMIDRARANAERLLSLIDDILDLSKIEAGRFEIHPEPTAIREVVNRWITQTDVLATQKGLAFEWKVDDAMPQMIALDVDAMSKIVTNLLSNAIKFTEKGAVKLEINCLGNEWRVRVTDSGIGIPADKQDLIFESFRQVDGSIRRSFGGTGLGLSIVKQLAGLLGGRVEVESKEGQGSTFTVTLPLVIAPVSVDAAPVPVSVPQLETQSR